MAGSSSLWRSRRRNGLWEPGKPFIIERRPSARLMDDGWRGWQRELESRAVSSSGAAPNNQDAFVITADCARRLTINSAGNRGDETTDAGLRFDAWDGQPNRWLTCSRHGLRRLAAQFFRNELACRLAQKFAANLYLNKTLAFADYSGSNRPSDKRRRWMPPVQWAFRGAGATNNLIRGNAPPDLAQQALRAEGRSRHRSS